MDKRSLSRRTLSTVLALTLVASTCGVTALASETETMTVGIYSTTDMHGRCYSIDPLTDYAVKNSLLRASTAVNQERALVDEDILVDVGDLLQGTAISSYNINVEGGENNPMAYALRYMGYDAFVPGNHEYNFSLEIQNKFYDLLMSEDESLPGEPVEVVCANILYTEDETPRFTPYIIKEYTVGEKTFRIGILGFENVNIPNWDLPEHYEGLQFVHSDNEERTYAYEWINYWQEEMHETEQCDFVIVAAHTSAEPFMVEGFDAQGQGIHMVENTTGIDMVMLGHDHVPLAGTVQNLDGEDVIVVNGGADNLTKTVLTLSEDGTIVADESQLLLLADYEDDAGLEALMKPYYDNTVPFVNAQIGTLTGEWDDVTDHQYVQSHSYNLVGEAQLWASGADVSLTTPVAQSGFALSSLFEEGATSADISLKDCYSLYRYDNNLLYMIEMTGLQLMTWMEHSAAAYTVEEGAVAGGGYGCDIFYGLDYEVYVGNPVGQRVQNVTFNGEPLTDDTVLKVALSSYRLSATPEADGYGWYAATGINTSSDKVLYNASVSEEFGHVGGSVPLIIGEYLEAMTAEGKEIEPPEASTFTIYPDSTEDMAVSVTRDAFIAMLYAQMGSPEIGPEALSFTDVLGDEVHLLWAAQAGIINGDGTGAFRPDDIITRVEAAAVLYNVAKSQGMEAGESVMESITDQDTIPAWAVDVVDYVTSLELMSCIDTAFQPEAQLNLSTATTLISGLQ